MARNFQALINEVGRLSGRPDSAYQNHIEQFINTAARAYTRQFPLPQTRRRTTILATGSQQQGLPYFVDRPVSFLDASNYRAIEAQGQWDRSYPSQYGQASGGYAFRWQFDGTWPVVRQPSSEYLTVEASASDARAVLIRGDVVDSASSGLPTAYYEAEDTLTLNGTTPVTGSQQFGEVKSISREEADSTTVFVRNSAGEAIAAIQPGEYAPRYVWVKWLLVPSQGTNVLMEYIPTVPRLRSANQMLPPYIPEEFAIWHAVNQAATDLERDGLRRLSQQHLAEVVTNEKQKALAFGDLGWNIMPYSDEWEDLEGTLD